MITYILRRILISIPLIFAITLMTFYLMHATPGNYFDAIKLNPQISAETIARYEKLYHLDQPLFAQYLAWAKNLFKGEFGYSFFYNVSVAKLIGSRIAATLLLGLASLIFTWLVAIPLGIWAAVRRNQFIDRLLSFLSYVGLSLPSFFLAIVLLYVVSQTGGLPLGGIRSARYDDLSWAGKIFDQLKHLVIPTVVLSVGSIAGLQRIMRGNMLAVLRQQYILTARAKGLPENRVIYRHALRNAINPLITIFGYELSGLLSGAALTEVICSWPGIGSLMLTAMRSKDAYLVMASMLMGSVLLLLGNLIADILLALSDPRIRYERK